MRRGFHVIGWIKRARRANSEPDATDLAHKDGDA